MEREPAKVFWPSPSFPCFHPETLHGNAFVFPLSPNGVLGAQDLDQPNKHGHNNKQTSSLEDNRRLRPLLTAAAQWLLSTALCATARPVPHEATNVSAFLSPQGNSIQLLVKTSQARAFDLVPRTTLTVFP